MILLSRPPVCWDYKRVPPCPALKVAPGAGNESVKESKPGPERQPQAPQGVVPWRPAPDHPGALAASVLDPVQHHRQLIRGTDLLQWVPGPLPA